MLPEPLTGRRRNGETFPMDCSVSRTADPSGAMFYTVILRDITDRVRDREALLQANRELRRVAHEFQQAVLTEVERRQARLARELHDSVASSIAGIALLLGGVRASAGDTRSARLVEKAQEELEQAADEVRQISRGMVPAGGEPGALLQALEQFAQELTELKGVECTVRSRGDLGAIQSEVATHLYRMVQEAANNAIRHGGATQLRVVLVEANGSYRLTLSDNGCGCDVEKLPAGYPGMGLRSMHARAGAIHGQLEVCRRPPRGGGCMVRVSWTQEKLRDAETGESIW
jgi:signal transduction histidine kinase